MSSVITIPLTRGYVTVVDQCDAYLADLNWFASMETRGSVYAYRTVDGTTVYLHSIIRPAPPGMRTDHRDRDTLNNRRGNLRVCTHQQNLMNRPPVRGYKGVSLMPPRRGLRGPGQRTKPWRARLGNCVIGYFATSEQAAAAYDAAAFAEFGEFAWLNRDHFQAIE